MFLIYHKYLWKLKLKYFLIFKYKIYKTKLNQKEKLKYHFQTDNIHDKLYNEYKDLEIKKDELNRKYCKEEAKKYPFFPMINHVNILYPKEIYYNSLSLGKNNNINYCNNLKLSKSNSLISLKQMLNINKNEISKIKKDLNIDIQNNNFSMKKNIQKLQISKSQKEIPLFIKNNNFKYNNNPKSLEIIINKNNKDKNKPKTRNPLIKRNKTQNSNNLLFTLNDYNSLNNLSSINTIIDNLTDLSRNDCKEKINKKNEENDKKINLNDHKKSQKSIGENSTLTNIGEKGTNYFTEKQSGIEQLSHLNLFENLENKSEFMNNNNKSKEFFYTYKTGKVYYNTFYSSNNNIPLQSISNKSTNILSPRIDCQNLNENKIRIQKNKSLNNIDNKNIFLDFSRDESSKKLSIQNSKNKNIIIYEKDNKDIYKKNKKKNLEISKVVFEEIIDNNYNNSKKLSSQVSLQSISDSKLYQIANYYITTDESFDKFMIKRKNISSQKILKKKSFSKK